MEQQARRADDAELRFKQSRLERVEAIRDRAEANSGRDLALSKRAATLRPRLDEANANLSSSQQRDHRLEKERDQRCVTDVQGVKHRLFEAQIAQPKPGLPGEVNVDGRCKGKRVATQYVANLNPGSLKCREGNIGGTEYTLQEMVCCSTA